MRSRARDYYDLWRILGTYRDRWTAVNGAEDVPLFGFPHGVGLEAVSVNVGRMVGIFAQRPVDDPIVITYRKRLASALY